ncbi:uncharacterized protein LOC135494406 isoform X2 [Lineus longissimus]|uniref:uncharacterized protein LOC135494406 isoform X2 n=1 Tax=Lineus longissimus TaxID=88925 RepID=UPI00315D6405
MNTKAPCSPSADIDKAMEGLQQLLETIGDPDHGSVTSLPTSSPDRSAHVGHSTDPQLEKSGLSMSHPDTPVASLKQKPPDVPQPNPLSHTEKGNTHESLVSNSAGETNRSPQSVNQKPGNSVTFSLPEYGQRVINRPGYHGVPNDIVGEPAHLPNSCTGEVDIKRNVTEHNWRDSMDEPRLLLCPAPTDKDATHLSVSRDNVFAGKQKHGPGKTSVGNGTPTGVEVDVPMSCPHPRTLDQTDGAYGDHDSTSESGSYDFTPDDAIRALNRKEEQMKLVDKLFPNYPDEVPKFTAPDGGYAWVVLAASFLLQGITIALPLSFGVLYLELLSYFEDSNTKTAWIGSIAAGFGLGAGPISSILCNYVGYRLTCIIGGLVAALGLFVSSFAPNVYMLCGSFGVLTGVLFDYSKMYFPALLFGASVSLLAAVIFFILVVDQFLQHKTGGEMRGRPDIEEDNFL